MDARSLYHAAATMPGLKGRLLRALVRVYRLTPPSVPGRREPIEEPYHRYLGGRGEVVLLGSNHPPEALAQFESVTQVDIKPLEHVDVVADAEELPRTFDESHFDYVICINMIEHTRHPWRVIEGIAHILKPGGVLYLVAPWMVALHSDGDDFYRFSVEGLRGLVEEYGLDVLEHGSLLSGHDAMRGLFQRYAAEVLSFNRSIAYYAWEWLLMWLTYPFCWFEAAFKLGNPSPALRERCGRLRGGAEAGGRGGAGEPAGIMRPIAAPSGGLP